MAMSGQRNRIGRRPQTRIRSLAPVEPYIERPVLRPASTRAPVVFGGGRSEHPSIPMRRLTNREHRILELVGHGLEAREISEELGITLTIVENHKQRIFAKLGVQNQAGAVSIAVRAGLLRPGPERRASGDT